MSQIVDSFERGDMSCRGYVYGVSAKAAPPCATPRYVKYVTIALASVVGILAVVLLGMVFGAW